MPVYAKIGQIWDNPMGVHVATLKRVAKGVYQRLDENGKPIKNQYQAKVRRQGRNVSQTFEKKEEAIQFVTETEAKIYKGEPVNFGKIKKLSLSEIFDDYIKNNTVSKKKKDNLERLKVEIGKVLLYQFSTAGLAKYISVKLNQEVKGQAGTKKIAPLFDNYKEVIDGELRQRKYKPSTVRKYYYDIKTALQWHSKVYDYAFNEKPFLDNPPPQAWSEPRERRLEDGELDKLLSACDLMYVNQETLKIIIRFQIYSCMRIGETLLMKWDDIRIDDKNPENSYIFVPKKNQKIRNKKNAKDRYVIMRPDLYNLFDEIKKLKKSEDGRVFHFWKSSETFGARFKVVTKNAGSKNLKPHDLRHEGISWLFENTNLTDIEISGISGHIELDTLKRYANLRPQKVGAKLWANLS